MLSPLAIMATYTALTSQLRSLISPLLVGSRTDFYTEPQRTYTEASISVESHRCAESCCRTIHNHIRNILSAVRISSCAFFV